MTAAIAYRADVVRRAAPRHSAVTMLAWDDIRLGPIPGERRAAVERILEVEGARFVTALQLNWRRLTSASPLQVIGDDIVPSSEEIIVEMTARQPILRWATVLWLKDCLGIDKFGCWSPMLKRMEVLPWQLTPPSHPTLTTPTLVESLVALRPTLEAEIKKGFRTSPLRVLRLAYRSALVYLLAAVAHLPGPQRALIQRVWPRIVEHLAATLESNHRNVMSAVPLSLLDTGVAPVLQGGDVMRLVGAPVGWLRGVAGAVPASRATAQSRLAVPRGKRAWLHRWRSAIGERAQCIWRRRPWGGGDGVSLRTA